MRRIFLTLIILMPTLDFGQYSALIVTGQSIHNWKCVGYSGEYIIPIRIFSETVSVTPEQGQDMSSFKRYLKGFKLKNAS